MGLIGCLCFAAAVLAAQTPRAKGLFFDATKYAAAVKLRDLDHRGGSLREMPLKLSLRPFCPTPQDQGAEPSCTAWAIAYGAMTIQQAIHRNIRQTSDVDKIACSKSFVYNQAAQNNPAVIPSVEETFAVLRAHGTCLAATFRNDLPLQEKPDALAFEEAKSRRLVMVSELYDPDASITVKRQIQRFKRFLADSIPIVIGMRLPYSFSNFNEKTFQYDPEEPIDSAAHALCLVGYDDVDSTFECLNSWGASWGGDNGFVRLRYQDVFKLICCAYRVTPAYLAGSRVPDSTVEVILRQSIGYKGQTTAQFEELRVRYDTSLKLYQTVEKNWQIGRGFQLALRSAPNNCWVYVFNLSQSGEVTLLHRDQFNSHIVEKILPTETSRYEIEEPGTELLCFLVSPTPLPAFREPLQLLLESNPADMQEQTILFFKNRVDEKLVFNTNRMRFSLPKDGFSKAALWFLKIETP